MIIDIKVISDEETKRLFKEGVKIRGYINHGFLSEIGLPQRSKLVVVEQEGRGGFFKKMYFKRR